MIKSMYSKSKVCDRNTCTLFIERITCIKQWSCCSHAVMVSRRKSKRKFKSSWFTSENHPNKKKMADENGDIKMKPDENGASLIDQKEPECGTGELEKLLVTHCMYWQLCWHRLSSALYLVCTTCIYCICCISSTCNVFLSYSSVFFSLQGSCSWISSSLSNACFLNTNLNDYLKTNMRYICWGCLSDEQSPSDVVDADQQLPVHVNSGFSFLCFIVLFNDFSFLIPLAVY